MTAIKYKYICRKGGRGSQGQLTWYNWWLVKHGTYDAGCIHLGTLCIPAEYVGRKVRFRMEVIEDE